ncbi:unnamed protein product, partial [Iphiclides podalirius]
MAAANEGRSTARALSNLPTPTTLQPPLPFSPHSLPRQHWTLHRRLVLFVSVGVFSGSGKLSVTYKIVN